MRSLSSSSLGRPVVLALMLASVPGLAAEMAHDAPEAPKAPAAQAAPIPPAAPQPGQTAPQGVPLRLIGKAEFCSRMAEGLTAFGASLGLNDVGRALLAANGTARIVQDFKAGRATDYLSVPALASVAGVSLPSAQDSYLPLALLVGPAMGLGRGVSIALSPAELRFLPTAQRGLDIVVIAPNAAALNPERVQKIAAVARAAGTRLNVVWTGTAEFGPSTASAGAAGFSSGRAESQALAWLAAVTGGAFVNLGGPANPCSDLL